MLQVSLKTVYKNNLGNHVKVADKAWYDSVAVYCPDTKCCYFFLASEIPAGGVKAVAQKDLVKYTAAVRLFMDGR
ncbi:hypothetical protein EKK58_00310 [Candidatus Dependentiae bacterium]|nr:MAG: hypothetical protein EKK58_00310 [Candidatus Dependentiae bacterium]